MGRSLLLLSAAFISILLLASCGKREPFPLEEFEEGHILRPPTDVEARPAGKGEGGHVSLTWNLSLDDRYGKGEIIFKPKDSTDVVDFKKVKYALPKSVEKPDNKDQIRYEIYRAVLKPGQALEDLTDDDFKLVGTVEEGVGSYDDQPSWGLNNSLAWYTIDEVEVKKAPREVKPGETEKGYFQLEDTEKGEYLFNRFERENPGFSEDDGIYNPYYRLMKRDRFGRGISRNTIEIGTEANEYTINGLLNEHLKPYRDEGWEVEAAKETYLLKKEEATREVPRSMKALLEELEKDGWKETGRKDIYVFKKEEEKQEVDLNIDAMLKRLKEEGWKVVEETSTEDKYVLEKDGETQEIDKDINAHIKKYTDDGWKIESKSELYVLEQEEKTREIPRDIKAYLKELEEKDGWKVDGEKDYYILKRGDERKEVARNRIEEWTRDESAAMRDESRWVLYRGVITFEVPRLEDTEETKKALKKLQDDQWFIDNDATVPERYVLRRFDPETYQFSQDKTLERKRQPRKMEEFEKDVKKYKDRGWEVIRDDAEGMLFKALTIIKREYESTREDLIQMIAAGWEIVEEEESGDTEKKDKPYKLLRKANTRQLTIRGLVNDKADEVLQEYLANGWERDKKKTTDRKYVLKKDENKRTITRKIHLYDYEIEGELARFKSQGWEVDLPGWNGSIAGLTDDVLKQKDGRFYIPLVRRSDYRELKKDAHYVEEDLQELLDAGWQIDEAAGTDEKYALRRPFPSKELKRAGNADVEKNLKDLKKDGWVIDEEKSDNQRYVLTKEFDKKTLSREKESPESQQKLGGWIEANRIEVPNSRTREKYVLYKPKELKFISRTWQDTGSEAIKKLTDKLADGMSYNAGPRGFGLYKQEGRRNIIRQGDFLVYRVDFVVDKMRARSGITPPVLPMADIYKFDWTIVLIMTLLFIGVVGYFIKAAQKGKDFYIRPIAGMNAIEEAVGRAAETGKKVMYIPGIGGIADIATLASLAILSRIAEKTAEYDTGLIMPNYDPIVLQVAQEAVKEAYAKAGRPDAYSDDMAFFQSQRQFAYAAGVSGTIAREKPATIFLMGVFFAESLLLAEAGNAVGAIQIAGTDRDHQLPFFVTACDYTLIGEELYAAGAYLSRDPKLLGSLKGQDWFKVISLVFTALLLLGVLGSLFAGCFDFYWIFREVFNAVFVVPF